MEIDEYAGHEIDNDEYIDEDVGMDGLQGERDKK